MTLFEVVHLLEKIALKQPYIKSAGNGDIYDSFNNNPELKYGAFFVTQQEHQSDDYFDHYNLILFVADQLDDTLEDDRLRIQSTAKTVLTNIIRTFCELVDVDFPNCIFTVFTQKFLTLTAGCYVRVTFDLPIDLICEEIY